MTTTMRVSRNLLHLWAILLLPVIGLGFLAGVISYWMHAGWQIGTFFSQDLSESWAEWIQAREDKKAEESVSNVNS